MLKYPHRYFPLLLDFDNQGDRPDPVKERIPNHLSQRVFLLGAKSEPEALKQSRFGSFEQIGRTLAKECRDRSPNLGLHDLLRHNADEIERMEQAVRGFLFS
jgi:hypothetical protein